MRLLNANESPIRIEEVVKGACVFEAGPQTSEGSPNETRKRRASDQLKGNWQSQVMVITPPENDCFITKNDKDAVEGRMLVLPDKGQKMSISKP